MKVLFVTNRLAMGGIETNLVLLVREFTRRGHTVTVAAGSGVLDDAVRQAGGHLVALRSRLRSPSAVRSDVVTLRRLLRQDRPDVVHLFSATAAALHAAASLGTGRRVVISSVMGLQNSPDESPVVTHARNWLMTLRARRVLVISPAIGAMLRRLPVRRRLLVEQPVVGVDLPAAGRVPPDARARARLALGLPASAPVIVTIGALAPRKSHALFLDAAARAAARRPDARFLVVGDGPERAELDERILRLGLEGTARLVGFVPRLDDVLDAADVVVKPGIVEGFIGITVLEAQVRHLPVVAFETEDVRAAIQDGQTGLLVPSGDTNALGDAIVRLLDDPGLASRLGNAGAQHAQGRFGIGPVVAGLESFYQQLLRESNP